MPLDLNVLCELCLYLSMGSFAYVEPKSKLGGQTGFSLAVAYWAPCFHSSVQNVLQARHYHRPALSSVSYSLRENG